MKKKALTNKELKVTGAIKNFNELKVENKSLIKGSQQRRLLKKIARCFRFIEGFSCAYGGRKVKTIQKVKKPRSF